ncbi:hypothetical protein CGRA01v4_05064 [Colletotrichum graminicola]|nr:hypothetical protein CGRA01v4_05064 [Colletotrichum graminicola]
MTWRLLNGRRLIPLLMCTGLTPILAPFTNPSIPHVPDKLIPPETHQSLLGSSPLLPPIWQVVMQSGI